MKIRSGFVSNSSSSSFLLDAKKSTTAQIAVIMMYQIQFERSKYECDEDPETSQDFKDALTWLENNKDFNDPVMLPWSCNYESFIWIDGDKICVDTCNNHDWSILGGLYHGDGFYDEAGARSQSFLNMSIMSHQTKEEFRNAERAQWEQYMKERKANENT